MNLMGPGTLSRVAAITRVEHISKTGDTRRSFIERMEPPARLAGPRHKQLVPS